MGYQYPDGHTIGGPVAAAASFVPEGLLFLASLGHTPGFIARGVATDGKTTYPMGSNDQTTPWLYGLWRYVQDGLATPRAIGQLKCYESAVLWARTEGFIPAPETSHAIKAVIEEAKRAEKDTVIVYNHSGHGFFDLNAYDQFMKGNLQDYEHPQEKIEEALKGLPQVG